MNRFKLYGLMVGVGCGVLMGADYGEVVGTGESQAFPWPNGKRMALSLTFDDARPSQLDAGLPLLAKHGVVATFYVSPRRMTNRLSGWRAAVKAGHEIGNHSMTHPCTVNYPFSRGNALEDYTLERMGRDIASAQELIGRELGVEAKTFAYPCGQTYVGRGRDRRSYVPWVAEHFLVGRGWLGEAANDPWRCDLAYLQGRESDGKRFEALKALVDAARERGAWLVLAGHEIGEAGSQTTLVEALDALLAYAARPDSGIWVARVDEVAAAVRRVRVQSRPR